VLLIAQLPLLLSPLAPLVILALIAPLMLLARFARKLPPLLRAPPPSALEERARKRDSLVLFFALAMLEMAHDAELSSGPCRHPHR
jgi:hypothetical protein